MIFNYSYMSFVAGASRPQVDWGRGLGQSAGKLQGARGMSAADEAYKAAVEEIERVRGAGGTSLQLSSKKIPRFDAGST